MIRRRLVGYARIERRRDHRRPTQLMARVGDHPAELIDISIGGIGISGAVLRPAAPRDFKLGDQHRVILDVPSYGTLALSAEVVRIDAAQQFLGLRFIDLDADSYRVIERLAIGRAPPLRA